MKFDFQANQLCQPAGYDDSHYQRPAMRDGFVR
jgi:hypothetical protein